VHVGEKEVDERWSKKIQRPFDITFKDKKGINTGLEKVIETWRQDEEDEDEDESGGEEGDGELNRDVESDGGGLEDDVQSEENGQGVRRARVQILGDSDDD